MTNRFTIPPQYVGCIPGPLLSALDRYFNEHVRTGGFLQAVLANDLLEAVKRADPTSYRALPEILDLLLAEAPANAWGSREAVEGWVAGAAPAALPEETDR